MGAARTLHECATSNASNHFDLYAFANCGATFFSAAAVCAVRRHPAI